MVNFKNLRKMIEVQGNGQLVTSEIPVSSFIRLHLAAKGSIELIPSEEEKVVIEADENLFEYIEVLNSGRTLYISSGEKLRKPVFTSCKIQVYLRQIQVLYIRCDGAEVTSKGVLRFSEPLEIKIQCVGNTSLHLDVPSLRLLNQSQGNVNLKGRCGTLEIKNQSEGDLDMMHMETELLRCKNMAHGDVQLFANKEMSISHYGQGKVHYSGAAVLKDVKQCGAGEIKYVQRASP